LTTGKNDHYRGDQEARYLTDKRPIPFVTATGNVQINGIILTIDEIENKVSKITRLYETYEADK